MRLNNQTQSDSQLANTRSWIEVEFRVIGAKQQGPDTKKEQVRSQLPL